MKGREGWGPELASVGAVVSQVCVECVGYLLEELRNPETLEQFRADVGDADIFIGSLIFIQELAEKVGRRVGERGWRRGAGP